MKAISQQSPSRLCKLNKSVETRGWLFKFAMPRVQMAALALREAGETPVVVGVQDEGDRLGGGLPGGADGDEGH